MKFSCEKETLLNLLNIASRAVTGKSSMPLLEGLLLAADADTLTITCLLYTSPSPRDS